MRSRVLALAACLAALAALAGCGPGATKKIDAPEALAAKAPDRPLLEGCSAWTRVKAAGLSVWSQACATQRLVGDDSARALVLETLNDQGAVVARDAVIQLFEAANNLDSLAATLMQAGGAPVGATCALAPAPAVVPLPEGVQRYVLTPTGQTNVAWERAVTSDIAPDTPPCGRYGVAIVGDRYLELRPEHPDKAVFVELGSEIQIYEPNTVAITPVSEPHAEGGKAAGH